MLVAFAIYLVLHFGLYVLIFRHRPAFRNERTIFCYHAWPALGVGGVTVGVLLMEPSRFAEVAIVLCLLGIYSLTFLELWSLAEGSYALSILLSVYAAEQTGIPPDLATLERIGATKKADRIGGLEHLGLVEAQGGLLHLTRTARIVTPALAGLARLIALQRKG